MLEEALSLQYWPPAELDEDEKVLLSGVLPLNVLPHVDAEHQCVRGASS